jgi:tetratricopeptide (TPR) repeat protein
MGLLKKESSIFANKLAVIFSFIVIAFIIYAGTISASFQFDDYHSIVENPDITINTLSINSLKKAAFTNEFGSRSLPYLSFALNYFISGSDTTSYHIVNMLIHIINAFLIYLIILRMFGYDSADDEGKERLALSAFFTALIWLVTPLNSQAVIFIVQRMTLLMALFFLLAFLCYLTGRKTGRPLFFLLAFISFILSVLSKENGVTLILVILLHEFVFVKKGDLKGITSNEKVILIALFVMMLIPVFIFREVIYRQFALGSERWGLTTYERSLTEFRVLVFYISLILLPLPNRLSISHDFAKSTSLFSPVTTIISIILVIAFLVFGIKSVKKSPYISFAILWFFLTLSVETIIPLELLYEHWVYLPSIFIIAAIVDLSLNRFYKEKKQPVIAACIIVAVLFSIFTMVRAKAWENEYTLWNDVLKKYPRYETAYNNLGIAYLEARNYQSAEYHFLKALEGKDNRTKPYSYYNLGKIYTDTKMYGKALEMYNNGLKINPESVMNLYGLGLVYFNLKDYNNSAKYFKMSNETPGINKNMYLESLNSLGAAYLAAGKNIEAERAFRTLAIKYPSLGMLRYNLAVSLKNQKKYKGAAQEFSVAFTAGYKTTDSAVETIRSMLSMNDAPGAERFLNNYRGFFEKYCVRDFLRGMISEKKRDAANAKKLYKSYITCEKSPENSPYVKEAKMRLNRL